MAVLPYVWVVARGGDIMRSIQSVTNCTGIPAFTIRNWEKRYGFPIPQRDEKGNRIFTDEEIDLLNRIKTAIAEGMQISVAINKAKLGLLPQIEKQEILTGSRVEQYFRNLQRFNHQQAVEYHEKLASNLSPFEMVSHVYVPILAKVGEGWVNKTLTIAQEHFISAFIRSKLYKYISHSIPKTAQGKSVVLAALSDESHEGALLCLTSLLALRDVRTIYLGPNLPSQEIAEVIAQTSADMLCLSYNNPENFNRDLDILEVTQCPVLCGGYGVHALEDDFKNITILKGGIISAFHHILRLIK